MAICRVAILAYAELPRRARACHRDSIGSQLITRVLVRSHQPGSGSRSGARGDWVVRSRQGSDPRAFCLTGRLGAGEASGRYSWRRSRVGKPPPSPIMILRRRKTSGIR